MAARHESHRPAWESTLNTVLGQIQVLPFIIGGGYLIGGYAAGLYWIAAGSIAIFIFSVLNAWVLLVEILR
jgi:modulator of FtsH protease